MCWIQKHLYLQNILDNPRVYADIFLFVYKATSVKMLKIPPPKKFKYCKKRKKVLNKGEKIGVMETDI